MSGVLLLDPAGGDFTGGTAHILVEDASRADAPAVPVATLELPGVIHRRGHAERLPFSLSCPDGRPGRSYAVRARVENQYSTERIPARQDVELRLTAMDKSA